MAKKRKTRSEKVLADTRHLSYHLETTAQARTSDEQAQTTPVFKLNLASSSTSRGTNYAFVMTDLRKTAAVTAGILITQLVLYFALNRL